MRPASASLTSSHCSHLLPSFRGYKSLVNKNSSLFLKPSEFYSTSFTFQAKANRLVAVCFSNSEKSGSTKELDSRGSETVVEKASEKPVGEDDLEKQRWNVEVGSPTVAYPPVSKLSLNEQAFLLFAFIACTTSVSLVIAAVPTLHAMGRAATSVSKLADTARQELPSTMAAIRLSGMEISDLTLELTDLSQEITDGVTKSAQAVQAAGAGIRQIGTLARQQTMSMIEERASLPIISLQPVVAGAAKKTSHAVGKATKTFINMISRRGHFNSENEDDSAIDRVDI